MFSKIIFRNNNDHRWMLGRCRIFRGKAGTSRARPLLSLRLRETRSARTDTLESIFPVVLPSTVCGLRLARTFPRVPADRQLCDRCLFCSGIFAITRDNGCHRRRYDVNSSFAPRFSSKHSRFRDEDISRSRPKARKGRSSLLSLLR